MIIKIIIAIKIKIKMIRIIKKISNKFNSNLLKMHSITKINSINLLCKRKHPKNQWHSLMVIRMKIKVNHNHLLHNHQNNSKTSSHLPNNNLNKKHLPNSRYNNKHYHHLTASNLLL